MHTILSFRDQELLNMNSAQLKQIAEADQKEKGAIAEIARWTAEDSRNVRVATIIALIYLPASLVMVSTQLISFSPGSNHSALLRANSPVLIHIGTSSTNNWLTVNFTVIL
jgi:hypothetical protein